jgi:hypothetical protein
MDTLAALCDILECGVEQLIEVTVVDQQVRKVAGGESATGSTPVVRRTTIRRPDGS